MGYHSILGMYNIKPSLWAILAKLLLFSVDEALFLLQCLRQLEVSSE